MKKLILFFSIFSVFSGIKLCARFHDTSSHTRFKRYLERYELVVVLFYKQSRGTCLQEREHNRHAHHLLDTISRVSAYKRADIKFLAVNLAASGTRDMQEVYGLDTLPVILLFEDGLEVSDKENKTLEIEYPFSKKQIRDQIEQAFGSRIQEILKEQQEREKRLACQRTYVYPYVDVGYTYYPNAIGYPYWYGYYGPSFYWGGSWSWRGGGCRRR